MEETSLPSTASFSGTREAPSLTPLIDPGAAIKMTDELDVSMSSSPLANLGDDPHKNKDTIIAFAQAYSADLAAERFGVPRSTIRAWMKSENLPLKPVFNTPGQGRKITYSRELDQKIADWVKGILVRGERVTVQDICQYARGLVQQENPDFTASTGWAQRFLTRHKIDLGSQVTIHVHCGLYITCGYLQVQCICIIYTCTVLYV